MIKAIETTYKGYRFRSRLEARWAVFFDALGIKWEYEPEGYELEDGTKYLPDFRINTVDGRQKYYEIKPENITSDKKFDSFSKSKDVDALMLIGDPAYSLLESFERFMCPRCGEIHGYRAIANLRRYANGDSSFYCESCDIQEIRPDDGSGLLCNTYMHKGTLEIYSDDHSVYLKKLKSACVAARSARFEYGECGATT